ncbi:glycosyltransferase family 9 protein [Hymenobacter elongatus]|nr:glycosyltransferase family 9 protein [Hymenobacter elongatus]
MRTFLVSRTDAIGDIVLTLPVCGQLQQLFPGCRVVLIGRTYTQAVADACPWVDAFLNYDELLKLSEPEQVAALRHYQAEAIVHVFPNKLLARVAQKANIPLRIGTRNRWIHWFTCNRLVPLSRRHSPLHEAQLNLQLLKPLGYLTELPLPAISALVQLRATVPLPATVELLLAQLIPGQLNIILHPRSRGSAREWGLAHFGMLARLLHQAGHRVFITGTAAEGQELAAFLHENAAFLAGDLTGRLTLAQLLTFIAHTDGLVAASTGPLHLAAALGRHALGLYPPMRPAHPGRWAPLGPHAEYVVFDRPACSACRESPAACSCIKAITAAEVAARIQTWHPLSSAQS